MKLEAIDATIRSLCAEIELMQSPASEWKLLQESDLLFHAVVCILGSQTKFESAFSFACKLKNDGVLECGIGDSLSSKLKKKIHSVLAGPLKVEIEGASRIVKFRFPNRATAMIVATMRYLYGRGWSIRKILETEGSVSMKRKMLVEQIAGFGPKQASLFLRRIGFSSDLAVLDTHILTYLRLSRGIAFRTSELTRLSGYESIEAKFQEVAESFGYAVGSVDLATWVTMRVAKREFAN